MTTPNLPRWMAYRSAKWFQCAMEDSQYRRRYDAFDVFPYCLFCRIAGIDEETGFPCCSKCIFGPKFEGCYATEGNQTWVATVASVWGEFA